MSNSHFLALLSLLDEPSEEIAKPVELEIISMGEVVLPLLERKWEVSDNELLQTRIISIIHKIQFNAVKDNLKDWVKSGAKDLLYGAYLVAKYHYPNLSYEMLNESMNIIRRDIWFEVNDQQSSHEKIRAFNRVFFSQYRFQRSTTNFYSIYNSLINSVIDSKRGNDVSLGLIYTILAQRLGLPIYGVNLPMNFILAYMNVHPGPVTIKREPRDISSIDLSHTSVLFYINPFIGGIVLSQKDIDMFLADQKVNPDPSFYRPISNIQIINLLLQNLESCYDVDNSAVHVDEIRELTMQLH